MWSLYSHLCCVSLGESVISGSWSGSGGMLKHKCFPVYLSLQMLQVCTVCRNDPRLQCSCRVRVYSLQWGALLWLLELWGCQCGCVAELNWKTQEGNGHEKHDKKIQEKRVPDKFVVWLFSYCFFFPYKWIGLVLNCILIQNHVGWKDPFYEVSPVKKRGGHMVCSSLVMLKVPTGLECETVSPKELRFLAV